MGRMKTPAYFKWRNGRPRWEPGPTLRQAGFAGRDLKSAAGDWLLLYPAMEAATKLNDEVAAWRAGGGGAAKRRRPPARRVTRSVQALYDKWIASPKFLRLKQKTRDDYRIKVGVFLATFGDAPVAALERSQLYTWWEKLYSERGHTMANSCVLCTSSMLTYATLIGWIDQNPACGLRMEQVAPRIVVWLPEECEALVALGDSLGGHYERCADAFFLALHLGQRQRDILDLEEPEIVGDGVAIIRQGKTGARVAVPFTPPLQARLEKIRARRRSEPITSLQNARRLVLRPDGKEYTSTHFKTLFGQFRNKLAKTMPSVQDKWFADTRDTAVTRLALAGCPVTQIHSITGHSVETAHQVIKHYLAADSAMARAGIDQLSAWLESEGIKV